MSCWVVPTIAAELWGVSIDHVLQQVRDGHLSHRVDDGFMFVDVAPNGGGCGIVKPAAVNPPTFTVLSEAEVDALCDEQLATPSLCAGWDVKTVAAHVISTIDDGLPTFLRLAARRRSLDRAIDELARQRAGASAFEIASALRQYADRPVDPPLFGPLDPLADVLVHLGDISIPLDIDYQPYPELVKLALDFLTGPWPFGFVPFRLLRGLSLYARDVDRRWGDGPEIAGPAVALMMTITGRSACLRELDGPGVAVLRSRLSA